MRTAAAAQLQSQLGHTKEQLLTVTQQCDAYEAEVRALREMAATLQVSAHTT
jgi:hypothetical protein